MFSFSSPLLFSRIHSRVCVGGAQSAKPSKIKGQVKNPPITALGTCADGGRCSHRGVKSCLTIGGRKSSLIIAFSSLNSSGFNPEEFNDEKSMMRDKKSMMKHNDASMMRIYTVIFPMMMSHH